MILPPHSNFRHYRLKTGDGRWLPVRETIKTAARLDSLAQKAHATDVYCTVSRWVNPSGLRERGKNYKWADNCIIASDFVVDCDKMDSLLQIGRASAWFYERGFLQQTAVKTGGGHHLWIHDFWQPKKHLLPRENELDCIKKMKAAVAYMKQAGIKFDYKVSEDARRVVRVWESPYHGEAGLNVVLWSSDGNVLRGEVSPSATNRGGLTDDGSGVVRGMHCPDGSSPLTGGRGKSRLGSPLDDGSPQPSLLKIGEIK